MRYNSIANRAVASLVTTIIVALAMVFTQGFFKHSPANAQVTLQLGGDFGRAKQALTNQGYSQIRLVGQGFTKFQVEACLRGVRYWFKSDSRGRVNRRRQIGQCRTSIDIQQAQQILAAHGYSRVNVEDRGGAFVAVACYGNERVRVQINHQGQVGNRRVLGQCRQSLSPTDVAASLQNEGYTRIKFEQRQLPVYVASACLGKRHFRLKLNEFAETLSQKRIGDCRGPLNANNLKKYLENQGYTKVLVIDNQLPRYVAEVCKGRKRFELTLNRYGDVINRYNNGSCATRIDRQQIVDKLRAQGGRRIKVVRENNQGFIIEACLEDERVRIELNTYGELINERVLRQCQRFSIEQVKNQLTKRKFKDLEFFVQGCKKGKLVRFTVNESGDRSNREVLGRCR